MSFRQINVTNVRNINMANINVTNINNVHYRYQSVAATAVSANAFRNSEPVERNIVRVDPQQFARAQVIPHPRNRIPLRALSAREPRLPILLCQPPGQRSCNTQPSRQDALR